MAMTTKTITYAFPISAAALAASGRLDFAAITLNIPETTSRSFRRVMVKVTAADDTAAVASTTSRTIGIKLGAVAFDDLTSTVTMTSSGESQTFCWLRDVTSYFTSNFGAGTSQTCQVGVAFTASVAENLINICVEVIITYDFDDASHATRIKTVRIPLESITSSITTTLLEVGTNQVPALDSFLPEASKVYRCIWFEIEGNVCAALTTALTLQVSLDAEAVAPFTAKVMTLNSSTLDRYIWVRNDLVTSTTHAFKTQMAGVTNRYPHPAITLCVTYEYNHTTSTSFLNSILLPFSFAGAVMGPATTDANRAAVQVNIQEPGPINLVQSAVRLSWICNIVSARPLLVRAGAQAFRSYAATSGATVTCGSSEVQHRIDSGSAVGAAQALSRGINTINIDAYSSGSADTDATPIGGCGGWVVLNYTSGKATGGDSLHNKSVGHLIFDSNISLNTLYQRTTSAIDLAVADTAINLTHVGVRAQAAVGDTGPGSCITVLAEQLSGEGGPSWVRALEERGQGDTNAQELAQKLVFADAGSFFKRWPNDPDPNRKLAAASSRRWRIQNRTLGENSTEAWLTYNGIKKTISGTLSGFSGGGGGITVAIHRSDTGEKVASATTSAGGAFTADVWDDTIAYFSRAEQDSTHVGSSSATIP